MSNGHDSVQVWGYTPRTIAAYNALIAERQRRDAAMRLSVNALAAQGKGKDIQRQVKEWSKS